MRTALYLGLGLSLAAAACADGAGDVEDELAGESTSDGDGKADDNGTYTYYNITRDLNHCALPACGGWRVNRVNRAETACTGGAGGPVWKPDCYVADIDWSDSGLSAAQIDTVLAAAIPGRTGTVLIRGYLRSQAWGQEKFGRLFVEEAWVAQTEYAPGGVPDGVFVKVKDNGVRCITSPCESQAELKLNSSLHANIAAVDFEPAGAGESLIAAATDAVLVQGGVIIVGYRYTVYDNGRSARGRRAEQVYLRQLPGADGACFVGGCSGQVCSDQEGVITTCEWQPEYACYADATCERQPGGACGWTPSEELEACLAAGGEST
jgi:hypothetical protein